MPACRKAEQSKLAGFGFAGGIKSDVVKGDIFLINAIAIDEGNGESAEDGRKAHG